VSFIRSRRIGLTLTIAAAVLAMPAAASPAAAATAPGLFVVTDYNGNYVRGSGVTGVLRQAAGRYEVAFNRNMDGCSYTATIGDPGAALVYTPGLVFTASGFANAFDVHVETKTLTGAYADFPFHLHAVCETDRNWAVVDSPGVLIRHSSSVTSATRLSTGQYQVVLNKPVTGCAYVATLGHPSWTGMPDLGVVSTASRDGNPNAVFVATRTVAGAFTDRPFHLQMQCPESGSDSDWAVVNSNGTLARGSSLMVSSQRLGVGRYEVYMIGSNHYGCAYVATPGQPGVGVLNASALVFTAQGHTDPTWAIYVETKNAGGGLSDFPFHLQVSGNC
jgi:hypothetical protein